MSVTGIQGQPLEVNVVGCRNLKDTEWITRQDPYVVIEYGNHRFRTKTDTDGGRNPSFNQKYTIPLIEGLREINVQVWNSNLLSFDDHIGSGRVQIEKALSTGYDDTAWPLTCKHGKYAGEVRLILHYANAQKSKPATHGYQAPSPSAPPYSSYPPAPYLSAYPPVQGPATGYPPQGSLSSYPPPAAPYAAPPAPYATPAAPYAPPAAPYAPQATPYATPPTSYAAPPPPYAPPMAHYASATPSYPVPYYPPAPPPVYGPPPGAYPPVQCSGYGYPTYGYHKHGKHKHKGHKFKGWKYGKK